MASLEIEVVQSESAKSENPPAEAAVIDVFSAAAYGDLEKLRKFVEEDGASLSAPHENGYHAIQWAALNNFPDIVQYIIEVLCSIDGALLELAICANFDSGWCDNNDLRVRRSWFLCEMCWIHFRSCALCQYPDCLVLSERLVSRDLSYASSCPIPVMSRFEWKFPERWVELSWVCFRRNWALFFFFLPWSSQ